VFKKNLKAFSTLFLIYVFLLSIKLISKGAHFLGEDFARKLISTTSDPFVGLFIGILATVVAQSSSLTTSLVVALVGGGTLNINCAIPIVMGANIGTTVTNTLVSLGHISWRGEFKRAFQAATVHDFFNILTVIILFPLQLKFGYLTRISLFFGRLFEGVGGVRFSSPVKILLSPGISFFKKVFIENLSFSESWTGIVFIILGLAFLFSSLFFLVKILRKLFIGKAEVLIDKYIFRNNFLAMGLGFLITVVVQSSSLTTSVMVPLAAAGVLSLEKVFVYTMGANVGTTFTALLASLAVAGEGRTAALTVALAHLFFNLSGIAIFYPFKKIRNIPPILAKKLSQLCYKRRYFSLIYTLVIFIVLPLSLIFLRELFIK